MDFIYKQYVALLQVGEQASQVGRLFYHRPGSHPYLGAHLVGQNKRERRLSEPRGAVE